MKLRLRSFDSKETLKIEVQNSCTLSQLRQILSQTLFNSPPPASIRLSLNRKDDLESDGEDCLQSLGIASGDLVFFSLEHPPPPPELISHHQNPLSQVIDSTPKPGSTSLNTDNTLAEGQVSNSVNLVSREEETLDGGGGGSVMDEMEVDDENLEGGYVARESFSVPGFLRKVFMEELNEDSGRHHKLIITAIHAVMLDSGFVGFDKKTNTVISGSHLRNELPSDLFRVSLFYTLPETGGKSVKNVVLKFQSVGKFINVYGTLENGSSVKRASTHWVKLNEDQLVPFLNVVWADCGEDVLMFDTSPEKEVFAFWRIVKDNLALPLLIDLCEESGLELPPCFIRLPTDLKLKILESLSGAELAKVSCVSSELRYLASSDDLWKSKCVEVFGDERNEARLSWKRVFAMAWARRKSIVAAPRRRGFPNPWMVPRVPRMIGEEFGDVLLQPRILHAYDPRRRNFPNLGVRGGGRFV
ncbi:hypothetical protein ABFX02_02G046200 [Erythranthe guttata]